MEFTPLPDPSPDALAHSRQLMARITRVMGDGSISFRRFMELALYEPGLGYYSAGAHKLGAGGDFVTAPELSPLFSRCLAHQCRQVLDTLDGADILEVGAGTGVMAVDLLRELQAGQSLPRRYAILELSPDLRQRQRQTLEARVPDLLSRVVWLDRLPRDFRGVVLGNEVLDAMPVTRFTVTAQGVRPVHVTLNDDRLVWCDGPPDEALTGFVTALEKELGHRLPVGYVSEYNPSLTPWLQALADSLTRGVLLFIDYGYPRREYYHPQRHQGTLLCHYRHRAHDDPLILVGLQDITANVDFTAVADAALAAGLEVTGYTSQAYFLFGCGLESLLAATDPLDTLGQARLSQQVKLLTLPGEMGERFKAIALCKDYGEPLRGFGFLDQRRHL